MSNAELIDELTAQVTRQAEIIREQAFTIAQLEAAVNAEGGTDRKCEHE